MEHQKSKKKRGGPTQHREELQHSCENGAAKANQKEPWTDSSSDRNAKPTEQHHRAADKLPKGSKRNRRFVRITSRKQWRKQKKVRKEIQRGKETVLNLSHKTLSNAETDSLGRA